MIRQRPLVARLVAAVTLLSSCTSTPADRRPAPSDTTVAASWPAPGGHRVDSLVPRPEPPPAASDTLSAPTLLRIDTLPTSTLPGDIASRLVFADRATGVIPIGSAEMVYVLPASCRRPGWLLVGGIECTECDAPLMIWVFGLRPGTVRERGLSFPYPGTHLEPTATGTRPVSRHRLFVGACLGRRPTVAVWLTESLLPPTASDPATRTLSVLQGTDALYLETTSWSEQTTRALAADVAGGGCREVPGRDQVIF